MSVQSILQQTEFSKSDIVELLSSEGEEKQQLFDAASRIKLDNVGNSVYLRGLIEWSNICRKDCYYCGIRRSNHRVHRYSLSEDETMDAIRFAYEKGFGSIAIQSGELQSRSFIEKIDRILTKTSEMTQGRLGITLSCGEQAEEVYRHWFDLGATRYLLRIETSSEQLYRKLHPDDEDHRHATRLEALESLKKIGYQLGTGVMIGLPFQSVEDLADDLLFMKRMDIAMCGMGPYVEHHETPLYAYRNLLLPLSDRLSLSLKMIAVLRVLMPDINIAATTALQSIEKNARMKAIAIGANVLMPNITPKRFRDDYFLYENKPLSSQSDEEELRFLENQLRIIGHEIGFFRQGNSLHYQPQR